MHEQSHPETASLRMVQTMYLTRIYFGTVLHLQFQQAKIGTFQAWKDATRYSFELTFVEGIPPLRCDYERRPTWERIVAMIEDATAKVWFG